MRWDFEGSISSSYLALCSQPFFMSIRIEFLASYSMLSQSPVTLTSLARLFINPEFCQCPLGAHANYSYSHICSRLRASTASACNWASYHTFNVMVLKCAYYITHIILNVLQTPCTIASQVEFELGLQVWRDGSLPIKPSRPACHV